MRQKLKNSLDGLPKDFIVLAIVPSQHFEEANMHLLSILINDYGQKGSYLSINRPYTSMVSLMERNRIEHQNVSFIDCVSAGVSSVKKDLTNCVFINSPQDLTSISVALSELMKKPKQDFVFLDSLNLLFQYNNTRLVIRFIHSLISRIRLSGLKGVMLSLSEDTDKKIVAELSQLCDKVIDLT
ncbi:hypothetical protein HY643_03805 [Candidatus Woesearchaeota archaeon]|nr:hypothetical protein [Candidatus Woesearchaeota archaeon]